MLACLIIHPQLTLREINPLAISRGCALPVVPAINNPVKLFRIPIKIEIPFFAIALVLGLSRSRDIALLVEWILVVFASILVHEFGHAFAARAFGLSPEIRLYQMGGLTSWQSEIEISPLKHLAISLAGPAMGFLLGSFVFLLGPAFLRAFPARLSALVYFDLLWVNVGWGLFNLLPMLPLDGGQVLTTLEAWLLRRKDQIFSHALSFLIALAVTVAAFSARQPWIGFLGIFFAYLNGNLLFRKLQTHRDRKLRFDLDQIKEAIEKNELDPALDGIAKVQRLAKSPETRREVSHLLVVVYLKQENLEEAEEELRRYTVFYGGDSYLQGALHFCKGEMKAAQSYLKTVFEHLPEQQVGVMFYKTLVATEDFAGALDLALNPAMASVGWELLVDLQTEAFNHGVFKISADAGIRAYERKIDAKVAYNVACAYARDSNLSEAMEWVRRALDAGFGDRDALLSDPDLEAVRSVPEFGSIVARFNVRNI